MLSDLAEHAGSLVTLIGALVSVCAFLIVAIWKLNGMMIKSVTDKLEKHLIDSRTCQENLPKTYAAISHIEPQMTILFDRQNRLREEILPRDFVRRDELAAWNKMNEKGFDAITDRLDLVSNRIDNLTKALLSEHK
jgi:hypothetical protein